MLRTMNGHDKQAPVPDDAYPGPSDAEFDALIAHIERINDDAYAARDAKIATDYGTVRRYPRTLHGVNAAFPRDPQYAEAVHEPETDVLDVLASISPLTWFVVGISLASAVFIVFWR